jgi:hypothetical protein
MIARHERPEYDIRRFFDIRVSEGLLIQIWIFLFMILYLILQGIEG